MMPENMGTHKKPGAVPRSSAFLQVPVSVFEHGHHLKKVPVAFCLSAFFAIEFSVNVHEFTAFFDLLPASAAPGAFGKNDLYRFFLFSAEYTHYRRLPSRYTSDTTHYACRKMHSPIPS